MKKKLSVLNLLILFSITTIAQDSIQQSTIFFYNVVVHEKIVKQSEKVLPTINLKLKEKMYYEDSNGKKTQYTITGNKITASLLDTLHELTANHLKEKEGVKVSALNVLGDKVKYSIKYPASPNTSSIKKTIKNAPGEDSYCWIYINYFAGTAMDNIGPMSEYRFSRAGVDIHIKLFSSTGELEKEMKGWYEIDIEKGSELHYEIVKDNFTDGDFEGIREELISFYIHALKTLGQ